MSLRLILVSITLPPLLLGHGGGLDAQGGHNDRKNGGYHFHRGPLAGRSFSSKDAGAAALRKESQTSSAPQQAAATTEERANDSKDASEDRFECGAKRTCGEMSSCAEAQFYLDKCRLTRLDGDKDGTPCESLCR